jgi:hypothetical protein
MFISCLEVDYIMARGRCQLLTYYNLLTLSQASISADHCNLDLGQILLEQGRPVLEAISQSRDEIRFPVIL